MSARILLADDDSSLRFVLSQALGKEGYAVRATGNVATLAKWVKEGEGDLVLSDVYMGDDCVFDALPGMRTARPNLPVIVMSAQSTVTTALSAAGAGAFDYVPKPFDLDELMAVVRRALDGGPDAKTRAQASKAEKEERLPLIGRSQAMQDVYRVMARVAGTDLTVLIEGESGTGKERVARAIHDHSRRASGPYITLSLAGAGAGQIDRDLFASDGKFAQAHGGTLFLEDVDELPADAQTRLAGLLHAEDPNERPNARLIVAAQRNLAALARQGSFRQDLFYRLNVVSIRLPPLRERLEDVGDLARAFLVRARREGLPEKSIDSAAIDRLKGHAFPGNVRELENLLRRAAALSPASVITAREIANELGAAANEELAEGACDGIEAALSQRVAQEFAAAGAGLPAAGLYDRMLAELERPLITQTLAATRGNQIKAAAVLGINRNTLRKKIQTLGIRTGRGD
ncbi:MAG TPA: sigma 54-interacting transcriptional regulator [Vitreimonas sp.]|uniref:sigma 54-interacting transcriptional regulator n=1 Tax=Vitreimonas sp. TaxID=3069702 RepID=UPI002D749E1F|nr:sigma 54-interacting transcriptional regulator [Vitreimonas sp.]HYD87462.1 sigma 54-interacting transcriptional regulator [Vitreimonas sp.]